MRQAVEEVRQEVANQLGGSYYKERNERNKLQRELQELQSKIDVARTKWENTKQFLSAQGIKNDASDFPDFNNYLLPSSQEKVEAEFQDEDDNDNDGIREYEM